MAGENPDSFFKLIMMMETMEYIEAYFQQTLSEEEKQGFEVRCEEDKAFAEEVAFYITSRQVIREELLLQKQQEWKEKKTTGEDIPVVAPVKKIYQHKWYMYAAACLLALTALYLFIKPASPQQLADTYINENYTLLSHLMDGGKDSLQQGIELYNNKNYDSALLFFEGVYKSHPEETEAKTYAGIIYLRNKNYDKALQQFDELANIKGLQSNPGLFLKATTLILRNKKGDKEIAKQLLKQVREQNLEGSEKAEEWEKKL